MCGLLLKRGKKYVSHTFLYKKKYFFPWFYLDLHKMTEMWKAFQITKSYALQDTNFRKRIKSTFEFFKQGSYEPKVLYNIL